MQVVFFLAGEITQVIASIPWVRCAWCWQPLYRQQTTHSNNFQLLLALASLLLVSQLPLSRAAPLPAPAPAPLPAPAALPAPFVPPFNLLIRLLGGLGGGAAQGQGSEDDYDGDDEYYDDGDYDEEEYDDYY